MENFSTNTEYKIVEHIAEGGMGTVYKAKQVGVEGFEKIVAIKTLLPQLSSSERFVSNFIAEAKLVANLIHENIVQIYQLNKVDDTYYFVLEYINGISLHDLFHLHKGMRMSMPQELAVYITSRVARGLAYAHHRCSPAGEPLNIVHCDVCPQNILITTEGLPKLTDFGIARASSLVTHEGISGKLLFMSPEQAQAEMVDFRSDIFSLGVVLFMLLTGEIIRDLELSKEMLVIKAAQGEIPWERLQVDDDLRGILEKMLATDREERYADTNELARDLEYYIYKDGYGPTIVTLENYLRKHCAYLYAKDKAASATPQASPESTIVIDKTRVMD